MSSLKYLLLAGLLGAAVSAQAAPVTYKLDPNHTMVLFSWNHFGYSNPTADLGLGEGTIVFDEQHPAQSSVEVTLPLARLDTHVAALDEHLKKADFFDAAKYPTAHFESTNVSVSGKTAKVAGNFTIHGVTKPGVINATFEAVGANPMSKKETISFKGTATIKRSDFGVKQFVPAVGDDVELTITAAFEKQ